MAAKFDRFPYEEGMRVRLRKKHPCGGDSWYLIRVGADARLECETCKHQMTLTRRALEKATVDVVGKGERLK